MRYNHICKAVYLMLRYEYVHIVQNLQQYRCNNAAILLQHAIVLQCCNFCAVRIKHIFFNSIYVIYSFRYVVVVFAKSCLLLLHFLHPLYIFFSTPLHFLYLFFTLFCTFSIFFLLKKTSLIL